MINSGSKIKLDEESIAEFKAASDSVSSDNLRIVAIWVFVVLAICLVGCFLVLRLGYKIDEEKHREIVDELEKRLRTQRNRPLPSLSLGLMSVDRNRKTGLPVTQIVKEKNSNEPEYLDEGTAIKREYKDKDRGQLCVNTFGDRVKTDRFPFDVKDITGKNDWIAIIHADGNGLGQIIRKIGHDKEKLKKFSKDLSEATKAAAKKAFSSIDGEFELSKLSRLPIRPVVLGGDDFTVICRADFAVQYVRDFMKNFESETKDMGHKLTCCAGIAFIKSSFPFYYGYQLAESLCDAAKKDAKDINKDMAPSCLMFHKVQDSFVVDYSDIIKRELCISESKTTWKYGPYYLNNVEGRWTIGQLLETVKELEGDAGNAVKTSIRRWLSEMHISDKNAKQLLGRAHQIANGKARGTLEKATGYETKNGSNSQRNVKIDSEQYAAYPAYDMLSLHSVINQITK